MRELYFHIGLHKTGSTFLQHTILANRERFAAAGLSLAPWLHPREGNHYPLVRELEAAHYDPAACAAIFDTIAEAPGQRLLITAEELCWTMADPVRAAPVVAAAARHFVPRVVVYLRRQDFLKESLFAQTAKTWYSGPIAAETHYDYDHDGRLRDLEARFGRENVFVVLYHDGSRQNDVVQGFIDALGLDIDRATLAPVPPANVSMHRREVMFLAGLPKPAEARRARGPMRFGLRVAAAVHGAGAIADDRGRYLMSPAERHAFVARFEAGNVALAARYGLAGSDRFTALPDPAEPWSVPAPITRAERLAALRAALRVAWRRRNLVAAASDSLHILAAFAASVVRTSDGGSTPRAPGTTPAALPTALPAAVLAAAIAPIPAVDAVADEPAVLQAMTPPPMAGA